MKFSAPPPVTLTSRNIHTLILLPTRSVSAHTSILTPPISPPSPSQLSSLPLQILLFFNQWFSLAWFMINFALYVYKGFHFHFPYAAFEWELAMLLLMAFIENSRLMLASRGNKTEQIPPLIWR